VTAATLHLPDGGYHGDGVDEQIAVDALTLLALAYERVGQDAIAARLAATYLPRSTLVTDPEVAFALSSLMARSQRIREALMLADALDDPNDQDRSAAAFVFGLAVLYTSQSATEEELAEYEEVLKRRIKRRKRSHPVEAGRAAMNLATFHRSRGRFDKATSYYEQAAKPDPEYPDRAHYWYEFGGALWGTGQFSRSVDAYGRAIELGTPEPLVLALWADSMMFAGQYGRALEHFERFHEQDQSQDDGEYRLKLRALRCICERLGLEDQDRRLGRALSVARGHEPQTPDEWITLSLRQLNEDALWGSAWLNLGVGESEAGRHDAALECHIVSTILIPADHEAWRNAIFTALYVGEMLTVTDLLVSGRRMGGDELIATVVKRSGEIDGPFPRAPFLDYVDKTLADHEVKTRPTVTLRMLSEGGAVEEILLTDEAPTPTSGP